MKDTNWNERYASAERLFSAKPDETLVELAADLTPGSALDLGAGEGRNSLWLAARGWRVTAVDLSDVALGRLAEQAAAQGLEVVTQVVDLNEFLAGGRRFDLVVLANVHPAPAERSEMLALAAAAVAPGGRLFLVGHHIDSLGKAGPPQPERLYTEHILSDAFPGLELLRLERREGRHGDRDEPVSDVVAWAARPAASGAAS
jgi:SAM-dependent methyltransferase